MLVLNLVWYWYVDMVLVQVPGNKFLVLPPGMLICCWYEYIDLVLRGACRALHPFLPCRRRNLRLLRRQRRACGFLHGRCRSTAARHDGPNHLGSWYNASPGDQMALITSDCALIRRRWWWLRGGGRGSKRRDRSAGGGDAGRDGGPIAAGRSRPCMRVLVQHACAMALCNGLVQ